MNMRFRLGGLLLCLLLCSPLRAQAQSSDSTEGWLLLMMSWITTVVPIIGPTILARDITSEPLTDSSQASLREQKLVLAARDDAAAFVASHGAITGARLEAALQLLRPRHPNASDTQLAEAILAQPES